MEVPKESNTIAASVIFLGGIVIDSFTSAQPYNGSEAATSLRTTAVVLLGCMAAPPIRQWMVFEQRVLLAAALATVSLVGWHEMGSGARVADAVYVSICLGFMLVTFWQDENASKPKMLVNTAVSTLFYSSFRLLRAALRSPEVARTFEVGALQYDGVHVRNVGYAYASATGTSANAFGAAAGIGVACVMMVNQEIRERGTAAATLVLTTAAFAQLTGAFVATMAASEHIANLPAVWSLTACADISVCEEAFTARRLAVTNGCTAGLWVNGFGTLIMAYAPSLRRRTRADPNVVVTDLQMAVYGSIATLVCIVCLLNYLAFTGAESYTDYAMVFALIAVPLAGFCNPVVGAVLFALAVGTDIVMLLLIYGGTSTFGHFTHCCNACMLILMLLYSAVTAALDFFWSSMCRSTINALNAVSGILAVSGTSISVVLFLGTSALYASYDGQHIEDSQFRAADNRYERTTAVMIAEHWLPALVWLVLYGCRCEVELLSMRARAITWYAAPLLPAIIWFSVLRVSDMAVTHAHSWYDSSPFIFSVLVVAAVPWSVIVWA